VNTPLFLCARFPYQAFDTRFKAFLGIPGCIAATIRSWCNSGADAYSKDPVLYIYFDAGLRQISKSKKPPVFKAGGMSLII
jgi:hypothetical protein